MTTRFLLIISIISIAVSLWLGAIDGRVSSVGDLLTPGNLPALVIFAAITFTMLLVASLGVIGTLRVIRVRRSGSERR